MAAHFIALRAIDPPEDPGGGFHEGAFSGGGVTDEAYSKEMREEFGIAGDIVPRKRIAVFERRPCSLCDINMSRSGGVVGREMRRVYLESLLEAPKGEIAHRVMKVHNTFSVGGTSRLSRKFGGARVDSSGLTEEEVWEHFFGECSRSSLIARAAKRVEDLLDADEKLQDQLIQEASAGGLRTAANIRVAASIAKHGPILTQAIDHFLRLRDKHLAELGFPPST